MMLKKNRTSALINATAAFIAFLLGEMLRVPGAAGWWSQLQPPAAVFVVVVLAAALIVYLSRSEIFMELGDEGFGWRGLLRWLALGLMAGILYSTLAAWLAIWPGEDSGLHTVIGLITTGGLIGLMYWLFFRRWIFFMRAPLKGSGEAASKTPLARNEMLFMIFGGLFVIAASTLGFFVGMADKGWPMLLAYIGSTCLGAAAVLIGLLGGPVPQRTRLFHWLSVAMFVLGGVGVVLVVVGLILAG